MSLWRKADYQTLREENLAQVVDRLKLCLKIKDMELKELRDDLREYCKDSVFLCHDEDDWLAKRSK